MKINLLINISVLILFAYDSIIIETKTTKLLIEADNRQTVNNVKTTKFKLTY